MKTLISFSAGLIVVALSWPAGARTVLFAGNSYIFALHSPARFYQPETVHDLNPPDERGCTVGGAPAVFKKMIKETGPDYDVSVETGAG